MSHGHSLDALVLVQLGVLLRCINCHFFDVSMARTTQFECKNPGLGFFFFNRWQSRKEVVFLGFIYWPLKTTIAENLEREYAQNRPDVE